MADKYKIIEEETSGVFDQHEVDITGLSNGIDRYMKETCLELLEYMAKNEYKSYWMEDDDGEPYYFFSKGSGHPNITKEELFDNFL
jgi:hypothetical protein